VAPDRVRHPIDLNFTDAGYPVRFQLDEEGLVGSLVLHLRQAMDAANIGWRRWILDYSQQRQFKLMQNLGVDMSRVEQWLTLTLTMIGLILSLVAMGITLKGRRRQDPLVKIYQRFCIKLARAGLPRRPAEGPLDYSRRIATQRPDLITQVEKILDTYIRLRYGPHPTHTTVRYFAEQVRSFRPKKPVKQAN
jgi:hypothetical protein